jgi:ABC-type branched-subunit amino acid transport system substrate-binding protein
MRGLLVAMIVGAACGHAAPRGSWVEEDAPGTSTAGGGPATHCTPTSTCTSSSTSSSTDPARVAAIAGGDVKAIDAATAAELEAAYARAPSAAIAVRRARLAHHAGDDDDARAWLARAAAAKDAAAYRAQADALKADLGAPVDPAVIAVLLPSTGRFAALGDELAAAIKLADVQGAKLVFLDTGGDEAKAAAAVDRAAAKGAIAILGPVGEHEAQAAARRAAERAIPIALLAPGDGADPSSGVFRLVTSPAAEARMAADFAAQEGYPTAGVLAPRDDVGDAMAAAFDAEAKAKGVAVTADGRYDPTASNLEPDVKAFLGLDPATNARLAAWLRKHGRRGWQTFVPDVSFSLLYVPDQYDRASLVAAYLPYLGVELRTTETPDPEALARKYHGRVPQVVQLLGSSGWNHPALVTRGGDAVAGAMLIDVFAGEQAPGPPADFAAKFHDATGRDPSSAAAQAYDAARLVFAARVGATTRTSFATALAGAHLDDGACGPAHLDEGGAIVRAPIVLQVDAGELALVPF